MSKNWFEKFINKLAKANEKEYGNKVDDCCERNDINNKEKN
ncbi:MAG: LDCC motif putative metal-binding protein [Bacillota bacterium]